MLECPYDNGYAGYKMIQGTRIMQDLHILHYNIVPRINKKWNGIADVKREQKNFLKHQ